MSCKWLARVYYMKHFLAMGPPALYKATVLSLWSPCRGPDENMLVVERIPESVSKGGTETELSLA